jgi:hypothetical protein
MPLPNQDLIREAVASHKYVLVINISDAYEQLHIVPEDVPKTLFSSLLGTFVSNILQQGDCNGPSSWQRLMTYVFCEWIGVEIWVYLDDIYVFTNTIEEHKNALEYVLKCLTDKQLYINPKKFRLYTIQFNCLGHYRDENGLHRAQTSSAPRAHRPPVDVEEVHTSLEYPFEGTGSRWSWALPSLLFCGRKVP